MATFETKAKGELSIFTEGIWRHHHQEQNLMLIPDGTFNVVVINHEALIDNEPVGRGVYFIPVLTRAVMISSDQPIYGLRLKIFSLHNLIQCNNIDVRQTRDVFKISIAQQLSDYVFNGTKDAEHLSECDRVLENLNYELLHKNYQVNPSLRDRVNYILDRKGNIQIQEMCREFEISRQGLHKSFKNSLGVGPKELSSIWRLNHYLWRLQHEDNFTSCAFDAGFYDQVHCIKEFQSKLGLSPRKFTYLNITSVPYIHSTIEKRFTNFYDPD
ncbi:helix-turn-helix transcriptional regulator [Parvicella tangerina]|uniref:HTH araC/xylS-type domain-containing protein n=1 Tax=Parvicella tangerina TaxID=2829795 RepID=A0A916NRS7_9FLAO|nr:AraC family transcriptional regulator [Parvicella tangerina]CAG5081983.1 hypothetical protein CRYO30217_01778 [Parvicella tangerina]